MKNNTPPPLPKKNSWWKNNWILIVFIPVGLLIICSPFVIRTFIVQAYKIPSGSMLPTLLIGDHIIVDKGYSAKDVKRKDIIIFSYPKDTRKEFVMRVIGITGDIIEIRDKVVYVNHNKQNENYVINTDPKTYPKNKIPRDNFGPVEIPENSLFVMGDNRDYSNDSRFWGFVDYSKVKAKVTTIYWSWNKEKWESRWDRIGKKVH